MLQEIFGASVASCSEERRCAIDEDVGLKQFALMRWGHAREAGDVITITNRGRSAVRYIGLEEATDRKG
eukprot:5571400-Pleurochrysis_carterae.AAC.1